MYDLRIGNRVGENKTKQKKIVYIYIFSVGFD